MTKAPQLAVLKQYLKSAIDELKDGQPVSNPLELAEAAKQAEVVLTGYSREALDAALLDTKARLTRIDRQREYRVRRLAR